MGLSSEGKHFNLIVAEADAVLKHILRAKSSSDGSYELHKYVHHQCNFVISLTLLYLTSLATVNSLSKRKCN